MDMNIYKYLAFLKTVEYSSFTKAAEYLNYSQSGISRMVRDLERDWNVTLLDRDRGGVRLTSDGLRLLPFIRRTYEEYSKLAMEVDAMNDLRSGFVRIGTFSSVATYMLPSILSEFCSDYPNIDFDIQECDYTETEQRITEGTLDCGFTLLPLRSDLDSEFIATDKLKVILSENHPMAQLDRFPIGSLEKYPFIMSKSGNDSEVTSFLNVHGIHPKVRFSSWDDNIIMAMVEKNLGLSILPELVLSRTHFHIRIMDLDVPASRDIAFVMQDRKTASAAVRKLLEYIQIFSK